MRQLTFTTMGLDDPECWDLDGLAEYLCCIADYDGKTISRVEPDGYGYWDIHFPDGHYILGVADSHIIGDLPSYNQLNRAFDAADRVQS